MSVNEKSNKPWKNESFHITFEEADSIRNKLIRIWKSDKKHEGMQIKVKYMSSKNKFVIKTRLHPNFETKINKEKKSGKSRKRNKKNSGGRMFDSAAGI